MIKSFAIGVVAWSIGFAADAQQDPGCQAANALLGALGGRMVELYNKVEPGTSQEHSVMLTPASDEMKGPTLTLFIAPRLQGLPQFFILEVQREFCPGPGSSLEAGSELRLGLEQRFGSPRAITRDQEIERLKAHGAAFAAKTKGEIAAAPPNQRPATERLAGIYATGLQMQISTLSAYPPGKVVAVEWRSANGSELKFTQATSSRCRDGSPLYYVSNKLQDGAGTEWAAAVRAMVRR